MQALDRIRPGRDGVERRLHLRHAFELDRDVKFAKLRRPESELTTRDAVAVDRAVLPQALEVIPYACDERDVAYARLQVAPDVIDIQGRTLAATALGDEAGFDRKRRGRAR